MGVVLRSNRDVLSGPPFFASISGGGFWVWAFGCGLGLVGGISLVGRGGLAARSAVAFKFSDPLFQSLDPIPEREN